MSHIPLPDFCVQNGVKLGKGDIGVDRFVGVTKKMLVECDVEKALEKLGWMALEADGAERLASGGEGAW